VHSARAYWLCQAPLASRPQLRSQAGDGLLPVQNMQVEDGPLCPAGSASIGGCILQLVLGISVLVIGILLVGYCCILPCLQRRRQEPRDTTHPGKCEAAPTSMVAQELQAAAGGVRTRIVTTESAHSLSAVLPRKKVSFASQTEAIHELAAAQDDAECKETWAATTPKLPAEANEIEEFLVATVTDHADIAANLMPFLVEAFTSLGVSTRAELAEQLESVAQGGNNGAASWMCTRDAVLVYVERTLQDAGIAQTDVRPLWTAASGLLSRALRRFELLHRQQQAQLQQQQQQQQQQQEKSFSCSTSTPEDSIADEELEQALNIVEATQAKLALLHAAICKVPRQEVPSLLAQRRALHQDPAYIKALLLLEARSSLHVATAVDNSLHGKSFAGDGCLLGGGGSCGIAAARQFCDSPGDTILYVGDSEGGVELEQHVGSPTPAYDPPVHDRDQLLLRL